MKTETHTERETYERGVRMGRESRAGQVYALIGDLGVGKTVMYTGSGMQKRWMRLVMRITSTAMESA